MSGSSSSNHYCCVPQCNSWAKRPGCENISFHCFPKENERKVRVLNSVGVEESIDRRRAWINVLKIVKPVSKYMTACSLHFTSEDYFHRQNPGRKILKRNAVPSLSLPKTSVTPKRNKEQIIQRVLTNRSRDTHSADDLEAAINIPNRRKVLKRRTIPSENLPSAFADKIHPVKQRKHVQKRPEEAEKRRKLAVQNTVPILSMEVDSDKSQNQEEIVIKLVADKGTQAVESHKRITIEDMIKTDTDMNAFTGIPSIELLDHICSASALVEKNSKALKLSLRQRILLSFIKLNLNMSFLCLAVLFGVSANSCKSYFFATVKILKKVLKYAVYWPEKDLILKRIQYVLMNSKIIE